MPAEALRPVTSLIFERIAVATSRASGIAGCVEVYPGPAALLASFDRSLLAK
jgi:hypothetical protein